MQKEDKTKKEDENTQNIPYNIRTMDSDLKKEDSKKNSFVLKKEEEITKEEALDKKEIEKKEAKQLKAESNPNPNPNPNFNPFLENLNPDTKNSSIEPQLKNQEKGHKNFNNTSQLSQKIPKPPLSSINKNISNKKNKGNDSLPPRISGLEKGKEEKRFSNNTLLIFLISIAIITIVSAFYYYFYSTKKSSDETQQVLETKKTPEIKVEPEPSSFLKNILKENSQTINLEDKELLVEIKNKKETLEKGSYFEIARDFQKISPENLLAQLELALSEDFSNEITDGWIYLKNQNNVLKLNLILELKDSLKIKDFLLDNENKLPELFKPLFVDEVFVLQDEEIIFQDSLELEGVRYYNLVEGYNEKALDWKIMEDNYLLVATSKDAMEDLIIDLNTFKNNQEGLGDVKNNQIDLEEENQDEVESQENQEEEVEIEVE